MRPESARTGSPSTLDNAAVTSHDDHMSNNHFPSPQSHSSCSFNSLAVESELCSRKPGSHKREGAESACCDLIASIVDYGQNNTVSANEVLC